MFVKMKIKCFSKQKLNVSLEMARPLPFAGRPLLTRLRLLVLLLLRDVLQFFNHIGRDTFPPALFSKRFQIATLSPAATADSRTGLPSGCPRTLQDGVTASRRKAALGMYTWSLNPLQ